LPESRFAFLRHIEPPLDWTGFSANLRFWRNPEGWAEADRDGPRET
jgi:hypothetical protein